MTLNVDFTPCHGLGSINSSKINRRGPRPPRRVLPCCSEAVA